GRTVCTANSNKAYLLSGTSLVGPNPFTTSAIGTLGFSGGTCTNCGVTMDSANNRALVGMSTSLAGTGGWQFLDLNNVPPTLGAVYASPSGVISENSLIDPHRNLI